MVRGGAPCQTADRRKPFRIRSAHSVCATSSATSTNRCSQSGPQQKSRHGAVDADDAELPPRVAWPRGHAATRPRGHAATRPRGHAATRPRGHAARVFTSSGWVTKQRGVGNQLGACTSRQRGPHPRSARGSAWVPQRVPHGFRMGSARVPHGFRTGSARVPHGFRTGSSVGGSARVLPSGVPRGHPRSRSKFFSS